MFKGSSPSEVEQPISGVLTSPNYPARYPNNLDLFQKIQVPEGKTIWIRFTDFDIELGIDQVFVSDAPIDGHGTLFNSHTGSSAWEKQIVSNTNTVEVYFHSDGSLAERGWRLEWGECQAILIASLIFSML